jgi:hypothetical protein
MQANKTVTINGRVYDAVTGLPLETKAAPKPVVKPSPTKTTKHVEAKAVHASPERSHTLHRRAAKKSTLVKRPKPGQRMDISRSSKVARFAPHPVAADIKKVAETPDIKPKTHPMVTRAMAKTSQPQPSVTSKQVKEAAIAAALAKPTVKPAKQKRFKFEWSRRFTIVTAFFVVLILGALLTYFNMPSLSVGFASAQAGIKATYPEYRPDGYSLDQPVTFSDGEVTLKFASNSGSGDFTITQTRSSWDSSAVLDNVVKKANGDDYTTTQERGLTIYSYDSTAVWVNGGILYKIVSNAPLSGEQIRHIATSL